MRFLSSTKVRLFLCTWIVFSVHFATNTVREHYPAFSVVEDGTFKVDRYLGFHPDIFMHDDGHAYIGNNVAASVIASIPLFALDPMLEWLEAYESEQVRRNGLPNSEYRNDDHPNSQKFFELAQAEGLTLRFGASTAVTSVLLMAPLSALMVVLMFQILIGRGVQHRLAIGLALLFGFGTPVFFRTGVLNHNMMLMYTTFVAFYLLWVPSDRAEMPNWRRRAAAGLLAGLGLALDYSGVIPLLILFGYLIGPRLRVSSLLAGVRESVPFVLASVPPVLFLLYSQWSMFGNPFLPGQYWMPDVAYSDAGFRGFSWPSLDLFLLNLFDPSYGMYIYGPLLTLALIPSMFYRRNQLILPRRERLFVLLFFAALLTFCAANQYSRVQFNSGFRYMVPLVPLVFLAATDHLVRMPKRWLIILSVPVLLNSWVISMVREPVPESWSRVLSEGIQLPWLTVLRLTAPENHPLLGSPLLPAVIVVLVSLLVTSIWRLGKSPDSSRGT